MITKAESFKQIGAIVSIHGPVVKIACDELPPLHQALETYVKNEKYVLEVYQHLDQKHVQAITLHRESGLRKGLAVYDTGAPIHISVSLDCLGRLLNFYPDVISFFW